MNLIERTILRLFAGQVNVSSPVDGDSLVYDSGEWINSSSGSSFVSLSGELITGEAITAGQEKAIAHTLGAVPTAVIVARSVGGVIEHGSTANTSTNVYIQNKSSSQSATVDLLVVP